MHMQSCGSPDMEWRLEWGEGYQRSAKDAHSVMLIDSTATYDIHIYIYAYITHWGTPNEPTHTNTPKSHPLPGTLPGLHREPEIAVPREHGQAHARPEARFGSRLFGSAVGCRVSK